MYCAVIVVLFLAGGPIQCRLATEIWCSSASGFFLLSIRAVIVGKHRKLKKVIVGSSPGFPHGVIDPIEVAFSLHKLIEILQFFLVAGRKLVHMFMSIRDTQLGLC
jgi:hypothetical protein